MNPAEDNIPLTLNPRDAEIVKKPTPTECRLSDLHRMVLSGRNHRDFAIGKTVLLKGRFGVRGT